MDLTGKAAEEEGQRTEEAVEGEQAEEDNGWVKT